MAFNIYVKLDVPEALRRGHPFNLSPAGGVWIPIPDDIDQESRELIAKRLKETYLEKINTSTWTLDISTLAPEPTIAGVVEAIRTYEAKQEAAKAKEAAEAEAKNLRSQREREAAVQKLRERLAARETKESYGDLWAVLDTPLAYTNDGQTYPPRVGLTDAERADLDAWLAEIAAENERRKADVVRRKAEIEAAALLKADAHAAERALWVEERGSPRLRRLGAEKIEHDAVYQDERLAAERPGWAWSTKRSRITTSRATLRRRRSTCWTRRARRPRTPSSAIAAGGVRRPRTRRKKPTGTGRSSKRNTAAWQRSSTG